MSLKDPAFKWSEDSRLIQQNRERKAVFLKAYMDRVFCISCGNAGGAVSKNLEGVIYICDDCEKKHGGQPPGMIKVSDEVVEQSIKTEEQYQELKKGGLI